MFRLNGIRITKELSGVGLSFIIDKIELFVITCDSCIMKESIKKTILFVVFIIIELLVLYMKKKPV